MCPQTPRDQLGPLYKPGSPPRNVLCDPAEQQGLTVSGRVLTRCGTDFDRSKGEII